jgi:hypothetical protein
MNDERYSTFDAEGIWSYLHGANASSAKEQADQFIEVYLKGIIDDSNRGIICDELTTQLQIAEYRGKAANKLERNENE